MFIKGIRFVIFVLSAAVLMSCGSGGEGGSGTSPGTGLVYITLGGGVQSSGMVSSSAIAGLPSDITDIIVTCTASDMSPVTGSLTLDGSPLVLEVPAGANRVITVDTYAGSILRMTGSATVSYIYAGSQTNVAITLTDVATLTITPKTVTVRLDETQQFNSSVTAHIDTAVTWSINGVDVGNATVGTIDENGFYTAPSEVPTPATVTIRATSNADSTLYAEAIVTVTVQASQTCLGGNVTVNSTADNIDANPGDSICDDGSGNCTLRAAIQEANACPGEDIIILPAGIYTLTLAGSNEDTGASGDLDISDNLSISGAGATATIVDGNALDRVFHAYNSVTVEISALTIRNGMASTDGGGGGFFISGGTLTVRDATISGNSAPPTVTTGVGNGGGIYCSWCTLNITNSTISGNAAQGTNWAVGGGILKTGSGIVNIINSTLSGNTSAFYGGGIQINGGTTSIINSTITQNAANIEGGGAYVKFFDNGAVINLHNTIIADQVNGGDCSSDNGSSPFPFNAAGDNIDSDGSCAAATTSSDLFIGPLADNGGPTQTHALLTGSPAVNAGDNAVCPSTDQRGTARSDGLCDIGAFELGVTINTIGTLGGSDSRAYSVSADGSAVVGDSDITNDSARHAFLWTETGGMIDLGTLDGGNSSTAYNSSSDGSVVVGYSMINNTDYHAFLWTQASGMIDLGTLGGTKSFAFGVSADGSVVVGSSRRSDNLEHAFIWTQAAGMIDLGTLLTGTTSRAHSVSADGSVVVGYSYINDTSLTIHAFRWTQTSGMIDLGTLGGTESAAAAVSADGSVVVGFSDITGDSESQAFLWTQAGGMTSLGTLGGFYSGAAAVSANGGIVVGDSYNGSDYLGFHWTETTGMQDVANWLVNEGVIVPAGWTLYGISGISDDGRVVAGTGYDSKGNNQAWVVRLDGSG